MAGSAYLARQLRLTVGLMVVRGGGAAAAKEVLGPVGSNAGGTGVPHPRPAA